MRPCQHVAVNSHLRTSSLAVPIMIAPALELAGCEAHVSANVGGPEPVPSETLVKKVTAALSGQVDLAPGAIKCPDPPQAKVGATVRCTLTDGTGSFGVTLTVRAVGENVDFRTGTSARSGTVTRPCHDAAMNSLARRNGLAASITVGLDLVLARCSASAPLPESDAS